jgi:hypothetical protein
MPEQYTDGQPIIVPAGGSLENQVPSSNPTAGQGYLTSSYYGNESAKNAQALEQELGDSQAIEQLSQKLGVNPDELGNPDVVPPLGTEDEKQAFLKKLNSEDGQRFRNEFKEYVGVDVVEAFQAIQDAATLTKELDSWRRDMVRQEETKVLKQELGQEFDILMPEIVDYFKQLPPVQQQALDNLDGARMIAALIRQGKKQARTGQPGNYPPYVNGNVRSTAQRGAPVIRMSEMVQWKGAELDARMGDVIKAKQAGTFINDL